MTDNTEDRPNTYLDEARKFKAAQENANALEVQKLINMLDAASEAVRKPALVAHIADGNFVVTNDAVQAALAILHQRKHVRWVKNERVLLLTRRR